MMLDTCNEQFDISYIACVASVSVLFRSKEWGTRVKDRAKNGSSKRAGRGWGRKVGFFPSPSPPPSFLFWFSFHFSRGQNRKSLSTVFFCSDTKRKRLLRRLFRKPSGRKKLGLRNAHTRSLVQLRCGVGLELVGLSALDPLSGQEKWRRLAGGRFGFIALYL